MSANALLVLTLPQMGCAGRALRSCHVLPAVQLPSASLALSVMHRHVGCYGLLVRMGYSKTGPYLVKLLVLFAILVYQRPQVLEILQQVSAGKKQSGLGWHSNVQYSRRYAEQ